jgi:hypothetical protein
LVNISAVGTSMTFTLMPVSSHRGPEKFNGSSAWRPASQRMVISVPAYCLAASTAAWAAWARARRGKPRIEAPASAVVVRMKRRLSIVVPP